MQQEFRSKHTRLNEQLECAEKALEEEMRLRENLAEKLALQQRQFDESDEANATLAEQKRDLERTLT